MGVHTVWYWDLQYQGASKYRMRLVNNNDTAISSTEFVFEENSWQHLALVINSPTVDFYFNGIRYMPKALYPVLCVSFV